MFNTTKTVQQQRRIILLCALTWSVVVASITAAEGVPSIATQAVRIVVQPYKGERYEVTVTNSYVVSPDGSQVAFIRSSEDPVLDAPGENMGLSIWIVDMAGENLRCLVPYNSQYDIHRLRFSPDGDRLYYQAQSAVVTADIHAINMRSKESQFITRGDLIHIVARGQYKNNLLIRQHRYFLAGGSYDWVWLFTPDGIEVGPVEADDGWCKGGIDEFLNLYEKE